MKAGVLVFPGSNCDHDCYHALKHVLKVETEFVWHRKPELTGYDLVVIPGGFSYGDYLRPGAIAALSPVMDAVARYASNGGLLLGICNGFQVLAECGLLPGVLRRNHSQLFVCRDQHLRVENSALPFTGKYTSRQVLSLPVAHGDGCYYIEPEHLVSVQSQVAFRYCDASGTINSAANPNGSVDNIAGMVNKRGNVLGMMPHPERHVEAVLGSSDGYGIFASVLDSLLVAASTTA